MIFLIKIAMLFHMTLIITVNGNTCFENSTGISHHNIYFESHSLDLTLQTSNKISQQLFNMVFKILVEEVLGYKNIEYVKKNILSNLSTFENLFDSNKNMNVHRDIPDPMVNLEIPVTPDLDYKIFLESHLLTECGNIAPSGRYGWFIPSEFHENSEESHWEYYLNSTQTKKFDLGQPKHRSLLKTFAYNNITQKYFCDAEYCEKGYYIPVHCKNMKYNESCAVLLTTFPDDTKFIIEHINELKLYMKVLWLGNNLKEVIDELTESLSSTKSKHSFIFLEWIPNFYNYDPLKFKSVYVPRCEDFKTSSQKCIYEMTKVVKIAWSELRNIAKPIFEMIYKMNFDLLSYQNLFQIYSKNKSNSFHDIACEWIKENNAVWSKWLPLNLEKKNIYIGGIFPLSGVTYNAHGIVLAARMAQDAINSNSSILKDYNLKLLVNNGQCQADMVLKTFIDYIYHNEYRDLIGILGPACSETLEPLAGVSKHYSTIVISYSAEGSSFSDRTRYPYFFRSIGENDHYKEVYLKLFQLLEWNQVVALTEDGKKYTEYISNMETLLAMNDIHLIANMKFPRNSQESSLIRYLEDLKEKQAKIIIADIYDNVARKIMCHAYHLGMTSQNGYVWFLPAWLAYNWYNTTYYNQYFNEKVNCTTEDMIEAILGYFSLEHAAFAPDNYIMQENITVASWRKNFSHRISEWSQLQLAKMNSTDMVSNEYYYSSNYAGYAYDAVWIYALAANELLENYPEALSDIHSEFTTTNLVKLIRETEFDGVSGKIKFYDGPSRYSIINVNQWINKNIIVGHFIPNMSSPDDEINGGTLYLNISDIKWLTLSGLKPTDGFISPEQCMLQPLADFLKISCSQAVILVNILSFGLFGVLLLTFIILFKRKYDRKMKLTEDYMKAIGFDRNAAINLSSLDKWETSRECVVINRKLGEGAFGTVYGGEALLQEGEGWVAVAVKTLKIGASREEKLDFLSEAESMKRFDHKNIVKLLGVCTKNEPFYTIMEYMLYGDLKTYLLARRHLINGVHSEEREEVSGRKLTSMALDIARALSYLAELKYVHRDVACRNCLVNAQRVVKLGDFGMSRLIFENDYYRFTRKGMLPVRWMAPESLCLGIFSPASDVWSFAILLYEIITFGNFPFQGMSNNEVLEYVKGGQTLTIPTGVKPQLEGLMKTCWNMDYKTRPHASEIAEFLANSPRLLSPCLDVPLSSVEMDFSDNMDTLPEEFNDETILGENSESDITNVNTLNSFHFDNPTYIMAETNKMNWKKQNNKHSCRGDIVKCQTQEENEPFI